MSENDSCLDEIDTFPEQCQCVGLLRNAEGDIGPWKRITRLTTVTLPTFKQKGTMP